MGYTSARPTDSSTSVGVTTYGVGGIALNPLSVPRVGADLLLRSGLTLGTAVGFGGVPLSSPPDGESSSWTGNVWLVAPRVGYLVKIASFLDLWPRAGITLLGGNLGYGDFQDCSSSFSSTGAETQSCTTTPGPSVSLFALAGSVEVVAALRATHSFNILAGLAYDHVLTATGSTTQLSSPNTSTSTSLDVKGHYFGPQLWLGLGGYLF